ncbi:hypothetical protein [Nocardioides nanhaiensis]|uniref:hypothetical protein n=1 Tax=Nocardioides nanhaiensis TaxID=1476871 RepID=UPI0031F16F28
MLTTRSVLRRSMLLASASLLAGTGTPTAASAAALPGHDGEALRTTPPPGWRNAYLPQERAQSAVVGGLSQLTGDVPLLGQLTLGAAELAFGHPGGRVRAAVAFLEPRAEREWYALDGVARARPLAQALLLAALLDDPRDFGGVDLVGRLEQLGAVGDTSTRALAARALTTAGSDSAAERRDDLVGQQCGGGWWTVQPGTCDGAAPDVTATAQAVLALREAPEPASVTAAGAGLDWLASAQGADGSFDDGLVLPTALAGRALGEAGRSEPAGRVAVWLRLAQASHQRDCGAKIPVGLVAPSRAAYGRAIEPGLPAGYERTWLPATAAASHAMRFPPRGDGSWPRLKAPAGYQRGGSVGRFVAAGVPALMEVCLTLGDTGVLARADEQGRVVVRTRLPRAGGSVRVRLLAYDRKVVRRSERVKLLQARRLTVSLRAPVIRPGGRQVAVVRDLAPQERVALRYRGRIVARGLATEQGVLRAGFDVGRGTGREPVVAVGRFANRRGSAVFTLAPASGR